MTSFAIIEAPSNLGLNTGGVQDLAGALLELGLRERLDARRAARLTPPDFDPRRDPETLLLNPLAIANFSQTLADVVDEVLDDGDFPVVLGGDCSILLGNLLALRRRGRYGLLFLDGHADFYQPEAEPNGEVASMDLALATGRGPEIFSNIDDLRPLVRDEDVFVFGHRDAEEAAANGSQPLPESIRAFDLDAVVRSGAQEAAKQAVDHLSRRDTDGFWIHLDADVLSNDIMPAVDWPLLGGLTLDELKTVLAAAMKSGRAVGIEVTIYNPRLDPDLKAGRGLVDAIASIRQPGQA